MASTQPIEADPAICNMSRGIIGHSISDTCDKGNKRMDFLFDY